MNNTTYKYDPPRPLLYDPAECLKLPNYNVASLNGWPETRIAYLHGELEMRKINATLIGAGMTAERRARRMFTLRNTLRSWTRDLMHNRDDAEWLTRYEQNLSFDALFAQKKAKRLTDDEAYDAIIESSTKSRPVANGGLDPNSPPPLSPVWPSFPIWGRPVLLPIAKAPPSPPPPIVGDDGFAGYLTEGAQVTSGEAARARISWNATGLAGRRAEILVEVPTDEIDNPADLPRGTKTVVIVSDQVTPHHTLFVHPEGNPSQLALVAYDQLSLVEE